MLRVTLRMLRVTLRIVLHYVAAAICKKAVDSWIQSR